MPTYLYRTDGGRLIERTMTVEEMLVAGPTISLEDGTPARRDIGAEHRSFRATPGNWPMTCEMSVVVPVAQVAAAKRKARAAGTDIDFKIEGGLAKGVFESPGHRRQYCEAMGMYDMNGGHSDPRRLHRQEEIG